MIENQARRSYTRKVFDLGNSETLHRFHLAHKHFKNQGSFVPIDATLKSRTGGWGHDDNASYNVFFPEFADGTFKFDNRFEGSGHSLRFQAQASHVQGQLFNNASDGHYVLYTDAFGSGIHLKVFSYHHGIKKVIIIDSKPDPMVDLNFDFRMDIDADIKVLKEDDSEWDKTTDHDFEGKTIRLGRSGEQQSFFHNALMWDSGTNFRHVPIKLRKRSGNLQIRKTVPISFLNDPKTVYPVYTDHPTNFFAGAGDGVLINNVLASWDTVHDAATGTFVSHTFAFTLLKAEDSLSGLNHEINRGFFPVDTSGIPDGDTITSAVWNYWVVTKIDGDNDSSAFVNVVQTSAASTSALITADYNQCGAVDNPTEAHDVGERDDITDLTNGAYNQITFNATGIGFISKTGTTELGMREGHDALDDDIAGGANSVVQISTSEETDTTQDPFLDVTSSAGGTESAGSTLFDGVSGTVNMGNTVTDLLGKDYTVIAWASPDGITGTHKILDYGRTTAGTGRLFSLDMFSGNARFNVTDDNGNSLTSEITGAFTNNAFSPIAGVREGDKITLHVNDAQFTSAFQTSGLGVIVSDLLLVGSNVSGTSTRSNFWKGKIGQIQVFNRALTRGETIQAMKFPGSIR